MIETFSEFFDEASDDVFTVAIAKFVTMRKKRVVDRFSEDFLIFGW